MLPLEELEATRADDCVSPVELATLNIGLGNVDKALDWAAQSLKERRGWMAYLNVHPIVDPLRDNPRFKILVEEMGL
ncbi:MAG TPA: hypothetical protein VII02_12360 [Gemmatimonadaceae bacterium]